MSARLVLCPWVDLLPGVTSSVFPTEPRKPSEAVPSMEVLPSFQPPPMDRIQQAMIRVPCWNSRWLVGTGFPCGETPFERETVSSSPTEQRHVPLAAAPWLPGALCATTVAARGSERVHVPSDGCRQAELSRQRDQVHFWGVWGLGLYGCALQPGALNPGSLTILQRLSDLN